MLIAAAFITLLVILLFAGVTNVIVNAALEASEQVASFDAASTGCTSSKRYLNSPDW